ncbi:hypothetical protein PFISCL1PPCAC_22694, partial [Pristionchus fissidentatus]
SSMLLLVGIVAIAYATEPSEVFDRINTEEMDGGLSKRAIVFINEEGECFCRFTAHCPPNCKLIPGKRSVGEERPLPYYFTGLPYYGYEATTVSAPATYNPRSEERETTHGYPGTATPIYPYYQYSSPSYKRSVEQVKREAAYPAVPCEWCRWTHPFTECFPRG